MWEQLLNKQGNVLPDYSFGKKKKVQKQAADLAAFTVRKMFAKALFFPPQIY